VTDLQRAALRALAKQPMTPGALGREIGLDHNLAVHNVMNPLYENGLVFRKPMTSRTYMWEMTSAGMETASQMLKLENR
jgi:hypothetical protein